MQYVKKSFSVYVGLDEEAWERTFKRSVCTEADGSNTDVRRSYASTDAAIDSSTESTHA